MAKKMVVYGAGAIGGQIGSRMAAAGHDVTLVEPWEPQLEAIRQKGLLIEDEQGPKRYRPPILSPSELDTLDQPIDILFLAVKSYDSKAVLQGVRPYLGPDSWGVSMQNSINEERLAETFGPNRVLGGVILINAVLEFPGHILGSSASVSRSADACAPGVYVGEYSGPITQKAPEVAGYLDSVWSARPTADLMKLRWTKLATSTMVNSVSGITGLRSGALLSNAKARVLMVRIAAEVVQVAEAHGHGIDLVLGACTPEQVLESAAGRSDAMDEQLRAMAANVSPKAATSLLQDLWRGRKTEVDYFNGLVVRKGREKNVPIPANEAVMHLLHDIEDGSVTPGPEALVGLALPQWI